MKRDEMGMDRTRKGPPHGELIAGRIDKRAGGRRSTAIIIPSYRDPVMLRNHLALLSRQTTYDFDVIAIHGSDECIESADPKMSILHITLDRNLGCAGAFYVGQRIALEEGYPKIILADDDCLPESEDLIETLATKLETEPAASPRIRLRPSDRLCRGVIHHYGAMRREVLESVGLSYLPFFIGGEDFDLMRRMNRKGIRIALVAPVASHPSWPPIFIWEMKKVHAYSRGNIVQSLIAGDIIRSAISLAIHIQSGAALAILGKPRQAGVYFASALEASDCRIGEMKEPVPAIESIACKTMRAESCRKDRVNISQEPSREMESDAFLYVESKGTVMEAIAKSLKSVSGEGSILSSFNKDIIFDGFCNTKDIPRILAAKSASIRYHDETYDITDGRGALEIMTGAFVFLSAIPVSVLAGSALALRGVLNARINGIDSEGYGLER